MKHTVLLARSDDPSATVGVVTVWHKEIGEFVPWGAPLATLRFGENERVVTADNLGVLYRKGALPGEAIEAGEPLAILAGAEEMAAPPRPDPGPPPYVPRGPERIVTPSATARALARHHARSVHESPHVITLIAADLTETKRLQEKASARLEAAGDEALDLLPFLVAAAAAGLARFPALNAQRVTGEEIRHKEYVHIALPGPGADGSGAVAPVVRDADKKSVLALARELQAIRRGTATPDLQRGATFTLTDLSPTGVLWQTPILHQPQSAHLIVGAERGGTVHLCLAHDARLVDGWIAAAFLAEVRLSLEEARFLFV